MWYMMWRNSSPISKSKLLISSSDKVSEQSLGKKSRHSLLHDSSISKKEYANTCDSGSSIESNDLIIFSLSNFAAIKLNFSWYSIIIFLQVVNCSLLSPNRSNSSPSRQACNLPFSSQSPLLITASWMPARLRLVYCCCFVKIVLYPQKSYSSFDYQSLIRWKAKKTLSQNVYPLPDLHQASVPGYK